VNPGAPPGLPDSARAQIDEVVAGLAEVLGDSLVGVYLHGSAVLGSFNVDLSDIDLLAVSSRKLTFDEKARIAALFSTVSARPAKVEIHLLAEPEVRRWRHPLPFDFHWGESWREAFEANVADALSRQRAADPDLAAHLTVTLGHGVALVGPPPGELLPQVPWSDYVDALITDLTWALDSGRATALYRTLSPARIWATLATGEVHSKDSGAAWALEHLPADLSPVLAQALARYRGERATFEPKEDELARYAAHVVAEIGYLRADVAQDAGAPTTCR
jgi:streptomycin 3"-adenylyltransferase